MKYPVGPRHSVDLPSSQWRTYISCLLITSAKNVALCVARISSLLSQVQKKALTHFWICAVFALVNSVAR